MNLAPMEIEFLMLYLNTRAVATGGAEIAVVPGPGAEGAHWCICYKRRHQCSKWHMVGAPYDKSCILGQELQVMPLLLTLSCGVC